MSTQILHFIERKENQDYVDQLISKSISDLTYISHDTTSVNINSATWNLTSLQLKNVITFEGSKENDSYLEQVRTGEGIDVMGSCPNSKAHNGRIYFCHYGGHFHQSGICYSNGNEELYLSPSMIVNDSFPSQMRMVETIHTKELRRQPGASTIQGSLKLSYISLGKDPLANDCFMVRPNEKLSQRFTLSFTQFQPSWCRCMLDIDLKLLQVLIVEHTSCRVPLKEGFGLQTEMREWPFFEVNYGRWRIFSKRRYAAYDCPAFDVLNHVDCSLPNLGPTFVSNNCKRSYALKFKVTFECPKKCTSTFTVATNIVVPVVKSEKLDLKSVTGFLFLQKFPLSTLDAQAFQNLVERKVRSIDGYGQVSHTSATASTRGVFAVVTIVSSIIEPERLEEGKYVTESSPIDYSNAIVYNGGKYAIHSGDLTIPLTGPGLFPPYDYYRKTCLSLLDKLWFIKYKVKPGESLKDVGLYNHNAFPRPPLMIRKVSIKIVELTHRVKRQQWYTELKTYDLLEKRYFKIEWRSYSDLFKEKPLSKDVSRIAIPYLNPTVVTTTVQRHNVMVIELKAGSLFSPQQTIVMSKELLVECDYDEIFESTMPPLYEEYLETTIGVKRTLK